ncbi:MAG: hypothetical protein RJA22_620 [Verrucomicrobiota bacterium]|jgi:hypothetical protein
MNRLNPVVLLLAAYLVVFLQATFNDLRHLLGVQVDLLPSLVVYTALTSGVTTLALVAACGSLWFDALSANPPGLSLLPLFLVGLVIQRGRDLILRDQTHAQMLLGLAASLLAPLGSLLILLNSETRPLIGWFSLWQWLVVGAVGAAFTPVWFRIFDLIGRTFHYRPLGETTFRADRQIKRGRQ